MCNPAFLAPFAAGTAGTAGGVGAGGLAAGVTGAALPGAIGTGAAATAAKTVGSTLLAGAAKAAPAAAAAAAPAATGLSTALKVGGTAASLAGAVTPLIFQPKVPGLPGLAKEPSADERARQARLAARLKGGGRSSTMLTGAGGAATPTGGQKAAFGL